MRFITPEFHAALDYALSIILIIFPFVLGFSAKNAETLVPVILGLVHLGLSTLTDFRLSLFRFIPFKLHLTIELAAGIFLIASPWIFNFYVHVYTPYVFFGLLLIIVSLLSSTSKKDEVHAMEEII